MSETNGQAPETKRILSLEAARANKIRKGNDLITVQQCYDMVIQECAKVHEHYLQQIPNYTARMIQDALLHYGLIQPLPGVDIQPVKDALIASEATPATGLDSVDAIPASGDNGKVDTPDTIAPLPPEAERMLANMPEELRAAQRTKFEEYYTALAKSQASVGLPPDVGGRLA